MLPRRCERKFVLFEIILHQINLFSEHLLFDTITYVLIYNKLELNFSFTNLPTPSDTPPDTEVDDDPHHQQTDSQVRNKSPTILYGIRDLEHVVSNFEKDEIFNPTYLIYLAYNFKSIIKISSYSI